MITLARLKTIVLLSGLWFWPNLAWAAADSVVLPWLGTIDPQQWSLAGLTAIIGSLDGLNVCSIGALILILSLVLVLGSRRLILLYGSLFIIITVTVYGLLIFLWHRLFVYLAPHTTWLSVLIGLAALFGGYYFFRQYLLFRHQGPTCVGDQNKLVGQATAKLRQLFTDRARSWKLIPAIIFFSAVIVIVEFPCSAALPVVFTGILAEADLPFWTALGYIGLYLFFYALIELIVLIAAATTKQIWFTSPTMVKWATLAGSLLLFSLAAYYLSILI